MSDSIFIWGPKRTGTNALGVMLKRLGFDVLFDQDCGVWKHAKPVDFRDGLKHLMVLKNPAGWIYSMDNYSEPDSDPLRFVDSDFARLAHSYFEAEKENPDSFKVVYFEDFLNGSISEELAEFLSAGNSIDLEIPDKRANRKNGLTKKRFDAGFWRDELFLEHVKQDRLKTLLDRCPKHIKNRYPIRRVFTDGRAGIGDQICAVQALESSSIYFNSRHDLIRLFHPGSRPRTLAPKDAILPTIQRSARKGHAIERKLFKDSQFSRQEILSERLGNGGELFPVQYTGGSENLGEVLIFPFSNSAGNRTWELANFKRLAGRIENSVAICGTSKRRIIEQFPNFKVTSSLVEMVEAIAGSKLVICNDSGPLHLASVLGIPCVVIHAMIPSNFLLKHYPLARSVMPLKRSCSPCHRQFVSETCSRHCPELQKVKVEQVVEEALKALETARIDAMLNPCKSFAQHD